MIFRAVIVAIVLAFAIPFFSHMYNYDMRPIFAEVVDVGITVEHRIVDFGDQLIRNSVQQQQQGGNKQ